MDIDIRSFEPRCAGEATLREVHRFSQESDRIDGVTEPATSFESFAGRLVNPGAGFGDPVQRAAFVDGRIAGLATMRLPDHENTHLVMGNLVVDPALRGKGIGNLLLDDMRRGARERGRTIMEFWGVRRDGPGKPWAERRAFRITQAMQAQHLSIDQAGKSAWQCVPPQGYRITRWAGRCPESLAESFAAARVAIEDAPEEDLDYRPPLWTVRRVREAEQEMADRRIDQRIVAAVHIATDTVAAITELQLHPHRRDLAYQGDTVALRAHRGRGLGVCVKAAMMRWLVADVPEVQRVRTQTATNNVHMLAVNHTLGYRDLHVNLVLATKIP